MLFSTRQTQRRVSARGPSEAGRYCGHILPKPIVPPAVAVAPLRVRVAASLRVRVVVVSGG
eukprot:2998526-Pyramimonas_sp.AAC.1